MQVKVKKRNLIMNYECRKYNGGLIFWTPVIADYGKTTQIPWLLTEERGRLEYTVCIWRNRYGNHLIWWYVYISRRFLNNFMIINLELGHLVFNKYPLNNSTFVSRKRVVKFCFDLIPWTLLTILTVCADFWWLLQRILFLRRFWISPWPKERIITAQQSLI